MAAGRLGVLPRLAAPSDDHRPRVVVDVPDAGLGHQGIPAPHFLHHRRPRLE